MTTMAGLGPGIRDAGAAGWAERLDRRLGRRIPAFLALGLSAYAAMALVGARSKRIWFDEWFTYEIARLPDLGRLLEALGPGPEQSPPLDFLLTRASLGLVGDGPVGLRAPSIASIGVVLACIFLFVVRRLGPLYAAGAALVALSGPAWYFSTEGRSYALMLGFSAAAMLCWQGSEPARGGRAASVGLAACVAGAVSSHYYAAIGLIPLGLGQLVRCLRLRRLDAATWAAMLLGGAVIAIYTPLILPKRRFIAGFWARPSWSILPETYSYLIGSLAVPMILLVAAWGGGFLRSRPGPDDGDPPSGRAGLLPEEQAAGLGFALLPVLSLLVAKALHGVFADRYVVNAIIGFALLVPAGVARAGRGRAAVGLAMVVVLGGWFGLVEGGKLLQGWRYPAPRPGDALTALVRGVADGDDPILIGDEKRYFDAFHEAPADLTARLVYVTDQPPEVLNPLRLLQPFVPAIRVEATAARLSERKPLLVYTTGADDEPGRRLLPAVLAAGGSARLVAVDGDRRLYRVSWPAGGDPRPPHPSSAPSDGGVRSHG